MTYKLVVNQTKVFEGGLIKLIQEMILTCSPNDMVEIYRKART